jgi:hypothetical protein
MVKQAIWVGIAIGVFFAGLGIGYAIFATTPSMPVMGQAQRQQMMNQMISDPQAMTDFMNQMMENPQAMQRMHEAMLKDPKHMQQMMSQMMMDPATMDQMHSMMFNDPQHKRQMQQMMGNWTTTNPAMPGSGLTGPMMGSGMMGQRMMMGSMMGTPITEKTDIIKTIDKIESLLDQVSSKYNDGDTSGALLLATEAYLENYEYIEGAIATKDIALMEKVELMLRRDLRHAINTEQPTEDIDAKIDSINKELRKIKTLFQ